MQEFLFISLLTIVYFILTFKISKIIDIVFDKIVDEDYETFRLKQHYQELKNRGYEIVCLCLQGSQNYGLQEYSKEYMSDIDSKAIVLPTFRDFVLNKAPVSTTIILDNGEHIDVKDIRIMFDMFKKENISYIELLYTKWKIINPKYKKLISPLWRYRATIAAYNTNQFARTIAGMSMEKKKALCHPYPNLKEKIDAYGFDGKQLSHCVRLNEFLYKWMNGVDLEDCYMTDKREELMNLKKQLLPDGSRIMTKEEAIAMCEEYDQSTSAMKDMICTQTVYKHPEALDILEDIQYKILKKKFKGDLRKYEKKKYKIED